MQLLIFASTPPPVHGQSVMVQTLLEGLPAVAPDLVLHHVNPQLSRDSADVGRWRWGKLRSLLRACRAARRIQRQHGPMTLYYVPAPGRRAPLYRDWLVMLLCRRRFEKLVLHWHGVGLGRWLASEATALERWMTRRLLGRADLSIVLAPELAADAETLAPKRVAIVPNGIEDPAGEVRSLEFGVRGSEIAGRRSEFADRSSESEDSKSESGNGDSAIEARDADFPNRNSQIENPKSAVTRVLFLGLCSREKGLFDTLTAIALANQLARGGFRLTVAGGFAKAREEQAFRAGAKALGRDVVRHVGFADATQKRALLGAADVFCFPTFHPHEGQPLALIEAMAHDLPIITTRWRAIPSMLPPKHLWLVEPHHPEQIAAALVAARAAPSPAGSLRAHYLAHFTRERHLAALAEALTSL